jgi:hypothetical protein
MGCWACASGVRAARSFLLEAGVFLPPSCPHSASAENGGFGGKLEQPRQDLGPSKMVIQGMNRYLRPHTPELGTVTWMHALGAWIADHHQRRRSTSVQALGNQ